MTNEKLKENATMAIDVLFADQSVSQEKTRENLEEIIELCKSMKNTLSDDDALKDF